MATRRIRASEAREKILTYVKRHAKGLTTAEAPSVLGLPERTARVHLAALYAEKKLIRTGVYEGTPLVFHYRYQKAKGTR
jgi:predicted ArsR family transcriptional regulator